MTDVAAKTDEELAELAAAGFDGLTIGIEIGPGIVWQTEVGIYAVFGQPPFNAGAAPTATKLRGEVRLSKTAIVNDAACDGAL